MDPALELAANVMLTLAANIPADTIKPLDYWPRLRSAFEAAAEEADDYPALLCAAGKRLGVGVPTMEDCRALYQLQPVEFELLRSAYAHRCLYVVILARVRKEELRSGSTVVKASDMAEAL